MSLSAPRDLSPAYYSFAFCSARRGGSRYACDHRCICYAPIATPLIIYNEANVEHAHYFTGISKFATTNNFGGSCSSSVRAHVCLDGLTIRFYIDRNISRPSKSHMILTHRKPISLPEFAFFKNSSMESHSL